MWENAVWCFRCQCWADINKVVVESMCNSFTLRWRHNERDSVSNHQPHGCLLNGLLRRRSKKTSKLRVTGLCVGNSPGPVNSPHKGPVTRKMFPFDDVIMGSVISLPLCMNFSWIFEHFFCLLPVWWCPNFPEIILIWKKFWLIIILFFFRQNRRKFIFIIFVFWNIIRCGMFQWNPV